MKLICSIFHQEKIINKIKYQIANNKINNNNNNNNN